jgi:deoxyribodipyrimidine photolyase-related protein
MKRYEDFLKLKNCKVVYVNSYEDISDIRKLIPFIKSQGVSSINYIDPVDNYLQKRIESGCDTNSVERTVFDSPLFLNTKDDLQVFF